MKQEFGLPFFPPHLIKVKGIKEYDMKREGRGMKSQALGQTWVVAPFAAFIWVCLSYSFFLSVGASTEVLNL